MGTKLRMYHELIKRLFQRLELIKYLQKEKLRILVAVRDLIKRRAVGHMQDSRALSWEDPREKLIGQNGRNTQGSKYWFSRRYIDGFHVGE